jgi:hypothetical protein
MGWTLESMAIEMPAVAGHPNRVGFRGVLTMVDVASDRPPAGARGHRVLLTRRAAEAAIPSLLGMGLDYAPALDRHDVRRKVGVITRAEIVGRGIEVGGFLYARDFPEIVAEIALSRQLSAIRRDISAPSTSSGQALSQSARKGGAATRAGMPALHGLGMSYEIADAQIEDLKAKVWVLNKLTFTGAAILRREKAAYRGTWIELEE